MGLSVYQLKRQLAYRAAQVAWAVGAPQGLVFTGGAFVSEDLEGNFRLGSGATVDGPAAKGGTSNANGISPFCRVRALVAEWDRKSSAPRIERAALQLWSTAGGGGVPGTPTQAGWDSHGINLVNGVLRDPTNPLGSSIGRDVDELIGRMAQKFAYFTNSADGFQGRASATTTPVPVNGVAVLRRSLVVEVFDTLEGNYYHGSRKGTASTAGSNINLSWTAVPDRFDFIGYQVQRGTNPGDAAPTTPAGGTNVPLNGTTTAQATGLSAGVYNFSVFALYNESGGNTAQTWSDPLKLSATV